MAEVAQQITVTLRGKSYVISSTDPIAIIEQAAVELETAIQSVLKRAGGAMRDDQLVLFAALQTIAEHIKQREQQAEAVVAHVQRVISAIDSIS